MRRQRRGSALLCLLFSFVLVAAACSSDNKKSTGAGASSSGGPAGGAETNGLTRAEGNPGGKVVFGQEQEYTSSNVATSSGALLSNTLILNLTMPQVFITTGDLSWCSTPS